MKTKKLWTIMMMLIMTFGISIAFSSCSKDDDSHNVKKQLVGAWKTSMTSSNWKIILLKEDGTMIYNYRTKKDQANEQNSNAIWTYNEENQTITMYREDLYYAYTYKVIMNDNHNSWAGVDANGKTYTFVRIEE